MRVGRGRTIAFALVLTVALVPWSFTGAHGEQTQATGKIKVGVSVPVKAVQGELIWYGAEMAAKEINGAGGVNVGGKKYQFELIKADSNEYASIPDAVATHERLMTVDKVNFVMGGGRSEAALAQQELLPKYKVINLDIGASDVKLMKRVKEDYANYKYFFHIVTNNPFTSGLTTWTPLVQLPFERFREMGIEKPRVAIVAEKVGYADVMVKILEDLVKKLGGEVVSVHRPSFTADTLLGELTAIKSSDVHLIIPCISGISGLPLVKEWAQLKVPAAMSGFIQQASLKESWEATGGACNYVMLNYRVAPVEMSKSTIAFWDKFVKTYNKWPDYHGSGGYDAIYLYKMAAESAGTLNADAVVVALEKIKGYQSPMGNWELYPNDHDYAHSNIYAPGYQTHCLFQWRDGAMKVTWPDGKPVSTWTSPPIPAFPKPATPEAWTGVKYAGTVAYELPPWVVEYWKGKK